MQKLWSYQEYVDFLTHSNPLVRQWAFDALDVQYSRVYTKEVASLIGDSNEHLACASPRYLARHGATETAPLILQEFLNGEGLVPSNCAIALGDMEYEEAAGDIIQKFPDCRDFNTVLGILHYLSKIRNKDCRNILLDLFFQLQENDIKKPVSTHLLFHRVPEDVEVVLDYFFEKYSSEIPDRSTILSLLHSAGASSIYRNFTEYENPSLLKTPEKAFEDLLKNNPGLNKTKAELDKICTLINDFRYHNVVTSLMFESQNIICSRFPDNQAPDFHLEIYEQDMMALAFLEYFSTKPSLLQITDNEKGVANKILSSVLACFLSIHEREGYLNALDPDAPAEILINTLRLAGAEFPAILQDRIVEMAPINELKNILTNDLFVWGDIWAVRIMERIGDKSFLPELFRVVREAHYMDFIYSDAIAALERIDESAHDEILDIIKKGESGDLLNTLSFLRYLPYSEAFDEACNAWENDGDRDGLTEFYGACLERIGDERGIEALQEMIHQGDIQDAADPLEVLAAIYKRDIPELLSIKRYRKEAQEQQQKRSQDLEEWTQNYYEDEAMDDDFQPPEVIPFRRDKAKIGRNAPCPCGSGKKYKKCCLNKEE